MNVEIKELLQEGVTVITPTNRLSRHLQSQYASFKIAQGETAWQTADILSWTSWLKRSWENIAVQQDNGALLLNSYQQQYLWQELIASSSYATQLLQSSTTARYALDAWNLLKQWEISEFPAHIPLNEDTGAFNSWAAAYQKRCVAENWFDESMLASIYGEALLSSGGLSNTAIALFGFSEFTPQQQTLLGCLKQLGCKLFEVKQQKATRMLSYSGFVDIRQEINAAANWSRKLLEDNLERGNINSIGIVLPNLQQVRDIVEAEFDDVLFPGAILSASDIEQRPYSISMGKPLNEYPLVHTALTLLALIRQPTSLNDIGSLLRSPFIKAASSEQQQRAQLDAALRDHGELGLSLNTILYVATNKPELIRISEVFVDCILKLKDFIQSLSTRQSPAKWAEAFSHVLDIFAWPGERPLNSSEYQTVEAWQEVMRRLVSLELVNPDMSQVAALAQLRRLVAEFSFQPETVEAPIQVLGMTGAAEMQFDHLWLMGLHEESWPQAPMPNPFIPITLQCEKGMPRANAELELEYARRMTQELVDSSPEVVLSYPENEKERTLRPSPILKEYLEDAVKLSIKRQAPYAQEILLSQQLEKLEDVRAPAIHPGDRVGGGTSLFKDQSACAFRAFARHRLYAQSLSNVDIGLDAMDRGSLVHSVMQIFWRSVKSQQSLLEMHQQELTRLIDECVKKAFSGNQEKKPGTFTERFTKLEMSRLRGLLQEWLEQEKKRSDFTISACEQSHEFNVENIELRTRIDRIDKLADGKQLIVDYKTGKTSVNDWFDERPEDPQLPLYAVSSVADIGGLAFARIKHGEMAYIGLTKEADVLPKTKAYTDSRYAREFETWDALFSNWKDVLSSLAVAFREGDAKVNPKNAGACRYCDLHAFCRIYEKQLVFKDEVE